MPDLTRSINGWMKSESVLPAVATSGAHDEGAASVRRGV
jgi:hypothetical protein